MPTYPSLVKTHQGDRERPGASRSLTGLAMRGGRAALAGVLKTYALAMWQAETEYRRCQVEEEAQRIPPAELVEPCREVRDELVAAARYVFRNDRDVSSCPSKSLDRSQVLQLSAQCR